MRKIQFMFIDAICIALTYSMAILALTIPPLDVLPPEQVVFAYKMLPVIILLKLVIYYLFKLYKLSLDTVGFDEIIRVFVSVLFSTIIISSVTLIIPNFYIIPEMYMIFVFLLEAALLSATRVSKRLLKHIFFKQKNPFGKRTLLIGAGAGGKIVMDEFRNNSMLNNFPVAFVDDDPMKIGKLMAGLPIYGPISTIPNLIDSLRIEEVVISIANIENDRLQDIIQLTSERPVKIRRLPQFKELKKDAPKKLLEVNVEDLLSRNVVDLDTDGLLEFIAGKRVMVTGAGGSVGSELVRQILNYNPIEILLVDFYENGVYDLQMELNRKYQHQDSSIPRTFLIASVYNYDRMKHIFESFKPELVFHAAAYKHVPLMEDSAVEAVRTNVLGTHNICQLCNDFHVQKMVLVSSDKAVRPTNIMGATKRFAEMILQHFDSISETKYSAVRFGNVLGSNGSVVPLFKRQIESGGPLTVTDKNIIRYFMTIPEAVGLILQSAAFANGGEIFILDMGEPVKIIDLAEKMIRLAGLRPYIDIDIKFTGLRPGEKLFEELLVDRNSDNSKTANKKIFIDNVQDADQVTDEIEQIKQCFEGLKNLEIKEMVQQYVPTYTIKK
jgi:FlaA1/EpsC-like NDP-sugar epimerase